MRSSGDISKKRRYMNDRGVTMVETVVAFMVLMIILAIIYSVIAFCSTLRMRAQDSNRVAAEFERELYNADNQEGLDESKASTLNGDRLLVSNYVTKDNTPLFFLTVNIDETSQSNLGEDYYNALIASAPDGATDQQKSELENAKKLSMYQIEAKTFVYNLGENTEKIIVPKAIQFIHKLDRP